MHRDCEHTPEKRAIHNGIAKQISQLCSYHPRLTINMLTLPAGEAEFERKIMEDEHILLGNTRANIVGYEMDGELYESCVRALAKYPRACVYNADVMTAPVTGKMDVAWLDWMGNPTLPRLSMGAGAMAHRDNGLMYATYSSRIGPYGLAGLRARLGVRGDTVADCVHNRMLELFSALGLYAKMIMRIGYSRSVTGSHGNPMIILGYQTCATAIKKAVTSVDTLEMAAAL